MKTLALAVVVVTVTVVAGVKPACGFYKGGRPVVHQTIYEVIAASSAANTCR